MCLYFFLINCFPCACPVSFQLLFSQRVEVLTYDVLRHALTAYRHFAAAAGLLRLPPVADMRACLDANIRCVCAPVLLFLHCVAFPALGLRSNTCVSVNFPC
jgi:hypothetical protein